MSTVSILSAVNTVNLVDPVNLVKKTTAARRRGENQNHRRQAVRLSDQSNFRHSLEETLALNCRIIGPL
jgi:hypothetical protein